jgi:hypothetical protein
LEVDTKEKGGTLANYLRGLPDFRLVPASNYDHMGAIIVDAMLQAGANYDGVRERVKAMREEKEIREALKRLKDERLRRARQQGSYSPPMLVAMIGALEWVLGDIQRLPDFK